MMVPTIHLNGTSRDELERQIMDAAYALQEAISKLKGMAPNGRDYYPQGPDAIIQATSEHRIRLKKVKEIYEELLAIYEEIT